MLAVHRDLAAVELDEPSPHVEADAGAPGRTRRRLRHAVDLGEEPHLAPHLEHENAKNVGPGTCLYHLGVGEVHCGTNVMRAILDLRWWEVPEREVEP